ncbi:MAG TPA: hypothetical protein DFR83_21640 [Deltaproteobacteria bacterium]|nr:hypothetical protein [Deltaproteobacteria bacterium]
MPSPPSHGASNQTGRLGPAEIVPRCFTLLGCWMSRHRIKMAVGISMVLLSCVPADLDTATPVGGMAAAVQGSRVALDLSAYEPPPTASGPHTTLVDELQEAILRPPMQEWPIDWSDERKRLAAKYFEFHKGWDIGPDPDYDRLTTMDPRMIVVHWTAGASARSAYHTFYQARQTGHRNRRVWNEVNLSAHFIVDRDGTIIRLMPETRMGRHTIGLNHLSIGIENVGDGEHFPLTEAQLEANAMLVRWLAWRYPVTHLIGHYEYRDFEAHPYFEESAHWFRTGRCDPGPDFMARLRAQVAELHLEGSPHADG